MHEMALHPDVAQARILMIDDEPTNLKLAEAMLRTAGYRNIVLVQDPRDALGRYRESLVDLILLDLNMPQPDGYALMAQFKALQDPLLPPILVLTAQGSRDHMLRALQAGARDFVTKPFDRVELLMRVRNLIDAQLAHRTLHGQWEWLEVRIAARTQELQQEIMRREHAQAEQLALLQEKEGLLREIHHRVKNNLQVIASLLRLEERRMGNGSATGGLQEMHGRLRAMGLLHESLYRSGTMASLDLGNYIKQIAVQAFHALAPPGSAVRLELNLASVQLGIDQASPCGLLVNELVSNALKHGFPEGRAGEVCIELVALDASPGPGERAGNRLQLRVSDSGIGLPSPLHIDKKNTLGLRLAGDLARQLGGTLEIGPPPLARFSVTFSTNE